MARVGGDRGIRVYVMLGGVLAAHAPDDDGRILHLLQVAGHVDAAQRAALEAALAAGRSLPELLFDALSEGLLLRMLYERFRENLFGFLLAREPVAFHALDAVFTENIQVGHDSRALVAALSELRVHLGPLLTEDPKLEAGSVSPELPQEVRIVTACSPPARVSAIVGSLAHEPSRTLEILAKMLESGKLVRAVHRPRWPEPVPGEDADLAAFQDYDSSRQGGAFSSDSRCLDRVELDSAPSAERAPSTETLLEMEDGEGADGEALKSAISLNFSGPKLSDSEAERKIEVVDDVLAIVAAALEAAEGPGAGRARVQRLLEAAAVSTAALFSGVEIGADGRMMRVRVLRNLRKRPAGEHRRILNRGLDDLVERALSTASEALGEEPMEALLEQIAGYQQRLGV